MLKNYLKIAFRNLKRYKVYSFINLFGLALGIACCIIILLYVQDEFSFDRYPSDSDRIYRIVLNIESSDRGIIDIARTPPPWGPSLVEDYPEVEAEVRFKTPLVSWLVGNDERNIRFHEPGFYFSDAGVFDFFNFEMIEGDPESALKEPLTLVLTESAAQKYFGDVNPMGSTLRLDNTYDFKVTGVMRDVPHNSHITFDILASISTLGTVPIYGGTNYLTWRNGLGPDLYTYIRLMPGFSPRELEQRMPMFLEEHLGPLLERINVKFNPRLQALTRIHLHSNLDAEVQANSDIRYVYIFSAVALFVLLIACINFMNLATARSAGRAREVGMRKVVGALKKQLIRQFFGESVLMAGLALILAVAMVLLILPWFNDLAGKHISLSFINPWVFPGIVALTLFVGLAAGSYPALFLSSFHPAVIFRGSLKAGRFNAGLRKALVIFQFSLSIIFIIGTGVVYSQLNYILNKDLGFDKERVVVIPMGDPRARQVYLTFKERVLQSPDVLALSGTSSVPGGLINIALVLPEGTERGNEMPVEIFMVDHDFMEAMGIELLEGRDFSLEFATDPQEAFLLNQTAAENLGWRRDTLNKTIDMRPFPEGRVIGVYKDFHAKSLHQRIEPLILHIAPDPDAFLQLVVRIRTGDLDGTLEFLRSKWREVYPNDPFIYSFLDDDFDRLYRSEKQRGRVFLTFSLLAVSIACLGLLGLASFTAEQKRKEIGIRKILGASTGGIIRLQVMQFLRLVFFANILAWPVAYIVMRGWLGNFAYRVGIQFWIFAAAALLATAIAFMTVGFQALKAAMAEPAGALRVE